MAQINIQRFYSDIVSRGRRNTPTFAESQRDAAAVATVVRSADIYRGA
jgi:hypothetical protein